MTLPVKFSVEGNEAFTSIDEHHWMEQIIQKVVGKELHTGMVLSFDD